MNILIAPNSMKGSLNADDFAAAAEKGFRDVSPVFHPRCVPVADGGDYTGEILMQKFSARRFTAVVHDPLGRPVEAEYGIAGETAFIEMAAASGLRLLKTGELNPMQTNTFGTGQLIREALDKKCRKIILGVGGSATVDGGIGMMEALGYTFHDQSGHILPGNAASLAKAATVTSPPQWPEGIEWVILTDVNNPLLGSNGAAAVFGPQKGADDKMISELEAGLENWISMLERTSGKPLRDLPGMGAAGGISAGPVALLQAEIRIGASYIFDKLEIDSHIQWADWVLTGEGRLDSQSMGQKAPGEILTRTREAGKPVTAIAGSFEDETARLFDGVFAIANRPMTIGESMAEASQLVTLVSRQIARLVLVLDPSAGNHHEKLGQAEKLLALNQPDEAAKTLEEDDLANLAGCWYLKGLVSLKKQEWGSVINYFRRCLELDPGHPKAAAGVEMALNILSFKAPDLTNP